MKPVQRQFGKFMKKGPGDKANVAVLLSDYEDADKMLTKIIDASKAWRDAWVSILSAQLEIVNAFGDLYNPIEGSSDGHGVTTVLTSQQQLDRSSKLVEAYKELKTDLTEEVNMMDARVIKPATEAKEYIQPIKKTIKKRDNKRLDWERYTDKVNSQARKMSRSDKENAALVKSKEELERAAEDFRFADDHLRQTLPPLITASFSIIPHLLAAQILIQNTLLAQYYTILHNYCGENGFPSPPPPMEDVITIWSTDFKPIQSQVEKLSCIARGQSIRQPMALGSDHKSSINATGNPRVMRIPSHNSYSSQQTSPLPTPKEGSAPPSYESSATTAAPVKKRPPPPPPKRTMSHFLYAEALYDFVGQSPGDLSFREGERIQVIKKTDSTDDWWEGKLHGAVGSFPANYCRIV